MDSIKHWKVCQSIRMHYHKIEESWLSCSHAKSCANCVPWSDILGLFKFSHWIVSLFQRYFSLTIIVERMIQLEEDIPMMLWKLEKILPQVFSIWWNNSLYICLLRLYCVDPRSLGRCIHLKEFCETWNENLQIRHTRRGQFLKTI